MAGGGRPDHRDTIGSAMVLVGLGFFVVVFVALFPVLTNPAGAYDRWFPPEREQTPERTTEPSPLTTPPVIDPDAAFRWETVGVEQTEPPLYRVRLTSEATAGDAEIATWRWDLGDGTSAAGESVTHDYAAIGSYTIELTVQDADGRVDSVRGTVVASDGSTLFGASGRIEEVLEFDRSLDTLGDGITDSLEGAVGDVGDDINATIDSALGSIGSTVRGGVVVALFGLASLAATIVAWRTAKIGVMLLVRDPEVGSRRTKHDVDGADLEPPRRSLEAA